jgi:SAM-dependent methyltransferase
MRSQENGRGQMWLTPQQLVDRFFATAGPCTVLDAGCGSTPLVQFPEHTRIVGLDISREQLDRNSSLDERIAADLQTCELPAKAFDAILCWYVLEHLEDPRAALCRLIGALAPGGILFLACPNPYSIKGLVTRFTPHSLHVWLYRRLLHDEHAGKEGHPPFRTVMSRHIAPRAIRRLARDEGVCVELETGFNAMFAAGHKASGFGMRPIGLVFNAFSRTLGLVTLGRYHGDLSEYSYVLRKVGR